MFTTNQLIFAACFLVVFIGIMIYSYIKDKKMHDHFYKGRIWVLISFLAFIGILFLIKKFLM